MKIEDGDIGLRKAIIEMADVIKLTKSNINLLKRVNEFKNRYCEVNHITSREHRVKDEKEKSLIQRY